MSVYFYAFWGAVFGGLAVVLGAFGAHALRHVLESYGQSIWEKAVLYQAIHALALLILPSLAEDIGVKAVNFSGIMFITGILLFSGSLYMLAVTGKKLLGALTPFGGVAFIVGWVWLAVNLLKANLHS